MNKLLRTIYVLWLVLAGKTIVVAQYRVVYLPADSGTAANLYRLKNSFPAQKTAADYISTLPAQMAALGYFAASADEVNYQPDSAVVKFYLGNIFTFYSIQPDSATQKTMQLAGISWKQKPLPSDLQRTSETLLDYYENAGYPFVAVLLDSMRWQTNDLHAALTVQPGPRYKIDSIHVLGKGKISADFLQHYLRIPNGSYYNKASLNQINQRLSELPYIQQSQPWELNMQTSGASVNLFLEPKRSSQIYALVGLAPANAQLGGSKLLLTGEANVNLKNALGAGESIGVNWQQLQYKSPRINLQFQYPYIFKSPFGLDIGFELFKKDSQWININARAGILYELSARQTGKITLQSQQTNVIFTDTNNIRISKILPDILDVSSVNLGVEYNYNSTNYRFNPRKGWDITAVATAGTKKLKRNNDILRLKDPANPGFNFLQLYDSVQASAYQFRLKTSINYYLPLGRLTVLKTALQSGWYQSPDIYRNELFQIGGYRLLRGFDEESIYTNLYSVFTGEFRYLAGTNSYFYGFVDAGYAGYKQRSVSYSHNYIGMGLGLSFETGNSLINVSFGVGKRDDLPLNLRQSKIHIGFVSFF